MMSWRVKTEGTGRFAGRMLKGEWKRSTPVKSMVGVRAKRVRRELASARKVWQVTRG